jgi:glycerol-3-phosphate acyltransferase PlsY
MIKIIYVALAFLCGSIPFAYIFTKIFAGVDIRKIGSGNPGTTNVFRAAGAYVGTLTFIADIAKGFVPVIIAFSIGDFVFAAIVGIAAIAGHIYTPWLKFKGGKGVATSLGVFLALMPIPSLIALAVFAVIFLCFGFVSLGSILGSIALVISACILTLSPTAIIFAAIIAAIVIYKHKSNIQRLLNGTENKFNIFGKK